MVSGQINRRDFLRLSAVGATALTLGGCGRMLAESSRTSKKKNVLFIAVDDLRPQLNCFGRTHMISPNIDRLAARGTVFSNCYCQVPVCGASRASLLTGIRPTLQRFTSYNTWADKDYPGALTLPLHFKNNGYHTISNGKIFHHQTDRKRSWSEESWRPEGDWAGWQAYIAPESLKIVAQYKDTLPEWNAKGPPYEAPDVADDRYPDGVTANKTIADLRRLKKMGKPFFLAAGFLKPHLPFNAPKKYWDLYDRDKINLADNPFRPKGAPDIALNNWGELRSYVGIPKEGPVSDEMARSLVHGYYACVSYTDALIGRLLDELKRLELTDNTIIVLWGDHGWNLREHGLWCKHCNFETALLSPLIVVDPAMHGGKRTSALTEFVDIYPALCELANLPLPIHLQGTSFVPLMKNPQRPWKAAAFSRWKTGDSIRTKRYRYSEWKDDENNITDRMLYDHKLDPNENINIAEDPRNAHIVKRLSALLKAGYKAVLPM